MAILINRVSCRGPVPLSILFGWFDGIAEATIFSPEVIAHTATGVAAVAEQGAWPAAALDGAARHPRLEGGEDEGERPPGALATEMQLAAEPAAKAAERLMLLPRGAGGVTWARMLAPSTMCSLDLLLDV